MNISTLLITPIFWATVLVVIVFSYLTVSTIKNMPIAKDKSKGINPLFNGLMVFALGFYVIWSMKESILWSIQQHQDLLTTQGRITESTTYWKSKGWNYEIWYEYNVDGEFYKSDRVSYGYAGSSSKSFAISYVNKYPVGKSVVVYYDSVNPKNSVLEPNNFNYDWIFIIIMIAALGFFFIAIGLAQKTRPTPRALDAGESVAFSSIFSGFEFFLLPSRVHAHPSAMLSRTQTVSPLTFTERMVSFS